MNFMGSKPLAVGTFFLFIFLTGFWLSRIGKPYSTLVITIHKLIGLATGVYLGTTVYRIHQVSPLSRIQIAVIGVTNLLFAVNVTTGSLLSAKAAMPGVVSTINKWFPYLTLVSTGILIYLLP